MGNNENSDSFGLIVLNNFAKRGKEVNDYIAEFMGEEGKNYIINISNPRFSNGESKVKINETVRGKDIFIISDVGNYSLTYKMYGKESNIGPDEHFQDIIRTVSAISGKAKRITVIMPLLYASRQHRREGRESLDCALSLRYLESLGVSNIITFDAHDPNIQNSVPVGSFDTIFPIYSILKKFIANEHREIGKDKMVVISPDAGAIGRATSYASMLGLELGLFYKRRDYTRIVDGKNPILKHDYIGPDVEGKNILIIDDMISSGDSVLDIISKLKERGCKNAYVISTFAFFTEGLGKFQKLYEEGVLTKVYSTNASYLSDQLLNSPWFSAVPLTKFLAKIIKHIHHDESLGILINSTDKIKQLLLENKNKLK